MWHASCRVVWQLFNASARASASVRSAHDRLMDLLDSPRAWHPQPAHDGEAVRASVVRAVATTRPLRIFLLLASNCRSSRANPADGLGNRPAVSTHSYHISRGESGQGKIAIFARIAQAV